MKLIAKRKKTHLNMFVFLKWAKIERLKRQASKSL